MCEQQHKTKYNKKYALNESELVAMMWEFIGKKITLRIGEDISKMAGHRIVKVGGSGPGEGSSKDIGLESGVNRPKCIPDVGVVKYT